MKSTSSKRPSALRGGAQTRPTSSFLGHVLVGVASRLRDATAAALASLDLSPREFGLLNQAVHEPQRTQAQLGEALRIDRTTVVTMLDRLDAAGWIERCPDPDDRRVYRITPTVKGIAAHRQAVATVLEIERRFLAAISPTQGAALKRALEALHRANGDAALG